MVQPRNLTTSPERSALMKRVRRSGTKAEAQVRNLLTSLGARYRLNVSDLPGSPDIANKARRKAVFVHGCFWHKHETCGRGRIPKTNATFWTEKLRRNQTRDHQKVQALRIEGFDVLVLWECELRNTEDIRERLRCFWFD